MARRKKYFNTKSQSIKARELYESQGEYGLGVYKMPKGSRHPGKFAVCSYIEYVNTY